MPKCSRLQLLLPLIVLVAKCSSAGEGRPISSADSILAVYGEDGRLASSGKAHLIAAVWADGKIVWSLDQLSGGPPYRAAQIESSRVHELLSRLEEDGLFEREDLSRERIPPEGEFTVILLRFRGKELKMSSFHEVYEERYGGTARRDGIIVGETRQRLAILQEEPPDYLFFRLVWSELRQRASALIPHKSNSAKGRLVKEKGAISWQEDHARSN